MIYDTNDNVGHFEAAELTLVANHAPAPRKVRLSGRRAGRLRATELRNQQERGENDQHKGSLLRLHRHLFFRHHHNYNDDQEYDRS